MKILDPIRTDTTVTEASETSHTHPNLELLNSLTLDLRILKSEGIPIATVLEAEDW